MNADTAVEYEIARWIAPNPHYADPSEAWVLPRCVSVWVVVGQLALDGQNVAAVAETYDLPVAAASASRWYYERHRPEVDERIAANRAFFAR